MRILNAALILTATSLSAQEPPRPAPAPVAAPVTVAAPVAVAAPRALMPGQWAIVPAPPTPMAEPVFAPLVELQGLAPLIELQGQGRVLTRSEIERLSEQARELAREQSERMREQTMRLSERAREQARYQTEMAREQVRMQAEIAREWARDNRNYSYSYPSAPMVAGLTLAERPPAPWAQSDPADSLYKAAYDMMNKGDYRRAALMFKELPQKFKYSQYAVDAMYWQAHALYRVGGNSDLQEALQVLETLKATYPSQRLRNGNADVGTLQVRIAGVLSAKGLGGTKIVRDALEANKNTCDSEEVQIRSAALNALMQTDPGSAQEYAVKALAKKDECSRELRRSAVYTLGNKRDGQHTKTLVDVAKNDPSSDVRRTAIEYLGRTPGDEALAALEDLLKTSNDTEIQRAAIRALGNNSNPRARNGIKALVERNDVSVNQRLAALDALREEMATAEDVAWLQALYPKVDNVTVRARIISAMARLGGSQNEKWFVALANNENESMDVRVAAVRQAGQSMEIAALSRLYDQTGQRPLRQEIVRQLGNRREPETIDKLGEIAKTGTDPDVRRRAIDALMQKKDERANKLILQLIDRP